MAADPGSQVIHTGMTGRDSWIHPCPKRTRLPNLREPNKVRTIKGPVPFLKEGSAFSNHNMRKGRGQPKLQREQKAMQEFTCIILLIALMVPYGSRNPAPYPTISVEKEEPGATMREGMA